MTNKAPTPLQSETLTHIRDFIAKRGFSPSVLELAALAGVSPNAVQDRINALESKKLITRAPGIARSIRPA